MVKSLRYAGQLFQLVMERGDGKLTEHAGEVASSVMEEEGWQLWKTYAGSTFMWIYMLSMV